MRFYLSRQFVDAAAAFEQALSLSPRDQIARLFLHKSNRHLQNGVPDNRTGVEVISFK